MKTHLTDRQRAILDYIISYTETTGRPPTIREISEHFRMRSHNGVRTHLRLLERKGYITRKLRTARGIQVLRKVSEKKSKSRSSSTSSSPASLCRKQLRELRKAANEVLNQYEQSYHFTWSYDPTNPLEQALYEMAQVLSRYRMRKKQKIAEADCLLP